MPKSVFQYPSPRELAEYLRQPGIEKAKGQFRIANGRCCLGHAADMLDVPYERWQGIFYSEEYNAADVSQLAKLPKGHWLIEQGADLAVINDESADDSFDEVIAYLEALEPAAEAERADG